MWPYWVLFALPAWGAITTRSTPRASSNIVTGLNLFGATLIILIGFRYEVGGDWFNYSRFFEAVSWQPLGEVLGQSTVDPAYVLVNWVAAQADFNIWVVNLFCSVLFTLGLIAFCRRQPLPWLAATVAVPYLVVVVAMGYSRQAVAIGLVMIAMTKLEERRITYFLLLVCLAALFHKTAVMLAPIGMLAATQNKAWQFVYCGVITLVLFYFLLDRDVDHLISSYITSEYQSQGATIRVAMNAIPALAFIVSRKRFALSRDAKKLWTILACCSLGFIGLLVVSPSSTAVDRMALYFVPIQLFVLSRLPIAWARSSNESRTLKFCIISYSAAVLFVWLNFADNSQSWVPYQIFPLIN
jgi:EpsG-like putative glucosyltransferase